LKFRYSKVGRILPANYLSSNHDSARDELSVGVLLDPVVQSDDVKAVEKLAFVFVDTFHLDIKNRGRVHFDAIILLQQGGQPQLVILLYFLDSSLERWVLREGLQVGQLLQMDGPFLADFLGRKKKG